MLTNLDNQARIFQVDAFTTRRFTGNPAAVMLFDHFPPDTVMQALAVENNLAETAFLVAESGDYNLRWFTPTVEVQLCGHATLASAAVVMERLETERREVVFHTLSGPLPVSRSDTGYIMNFPADRRSGSTRLKVWPEHSGPSRWRCSAMLSTIWLC